MPNKTNKRKKYNSSIRVKVQQLRELAANWDKCAKNSYAAIEQVG
jgi:hypothetical protein